MKYNEIEVKFYVKNPEKMRKCILDITTNGFGRYFETNIKYENRNHSLTDKNLLLRLRKSKKTTLTVKQFPEINDTEFKINKELEVSVSDFTTMNCILNILGYYKEQVYEKWREKWEKEKVTLCLDTMPYGCFLEIEGQPENIKGIAKDLQLKWNKRIILSYLEIFEIIKKKEKFTFNDLKFNKFKDLNNFERYRILFENNEL